VSGRGSPPSRTYVEERREYLRGRFQDLLVELGDRYAELGDVAMAGARYRQTLSVNPEQARARTGLERIGGIGAAGALAVVQPAR